MIHFAAIRGLWTITNAIMHVTAQGRDEGSSEEGKNVGVRIRARRCYVCIHAADAAKEQFCEDLLASPNARRAQSFITVVAMEVLGLTSLGKALYP